MQLRDRNRVRGTAVDRAVKDMDFDGYEANASSALARLDAELDKAYGLVKEDLAKQAADIKIRVADWAEELKIKHEPAYEHSKIRSEQEARDIAAWMRIGLATKIRPWKLPKMARFGLLTFLAGLDFYSFANAAAVILDVDASPTNLGFWLGGIVGLLVSIAALLLGGMLRDMTVPEIQKRLFQENRELNELREEADRRRGLPPLFEPNRPATYALGAVFVLTLALSLFARLASGDDENLFFVALLLAAPVIIVAIEFQLHDPLKFETVQRTKEHEQVRKQHQRLLSIQEHWPAVSAEKLESVSRHYREQRSDLIKLLERNGVYYDEDVDDILSLHKQGLLRYQDGDQNTGSHSDVINLNNEDVKEPVDDIVDTTFVDPEPGQSQRMARPQLPRTSGDV